MDKFDDLRNRIEEALTEAEFDWLGADCCSDDVWERLLSVPAFCKVARRARSGDDNALFACCQFAAVGIRCMQPAGRGPYRLSVVKRWHLCLPVYLLNSLAPKMTWREVFEHMREGGFDVSSSEALRRVYKRWRDRTRSSEIAESIQSFLSLLGAYIPPYAFEPRVSSGHPLLLVRAERTSELLEQIRPRDIRPTGRGGRHLDFYHCCISLPLLSLRNPFAPVTVASVSSPVQQVVCTVFVLCGAVHLLFAPLAWSEFDWESFTGVCAVCGKALHICDACREAA